MKKFAFTIFAGLMMFGLTSCTNDYTCTCTTSDSSGFVDDIVTTTPILNSTKSDAEMVCEAGNVTVSTLSTTCELSD